MLKVVSGKCFDRTSIRSVGDQTCPSESKEIEQNSKQRAKGVGNFKAFNSAYKI